MLSVSHSYIDDTANTNLIEGLKSSANGLMPMITVEMRIVLPNGSVLRDYSYKNLPNIEQRIVEAAEGLVNAVRVAEGKPTVDLMFASTLADPAE